MVICPAVSTVEKTPSAEAGPGGDSGGLPAASALPTSITRCDTATTATQPQLCHTAAATASLCQPRAPGRA